MKDKECMVIVFNTYFSSITHTTTKDSYKDNNESESNINPLYYLNYSYNSPFENIRWHYTSITEIKKIIKSLKNKSSYEYDKIPVKILKIGMPYIILPLTHICNESLSQGIFPDRLKYMVIKPNFKTGDKYEPSNYRPISLSFSKVFERIIYTVDCMNI
jgi:hypothetical protein